MHVESGWARCGLAFFLSAFFLAVGMAGTGRSDSGRYVGSEACAECHDSEYRNFKQYSKKAHSGDSVKIMAGDLTSEELAECYACHVTGFGKPGGFVSFDETPKMADAGCEVCHGPGYEHVEAGGDPEFIKADIEVSDCETCHNPERVEAFDFKPLLFGGAH